MKRCGAVLAALAPLAAAFWGCSATAPREAARAGDASVEVAPPASFVPFVPHPVYQPLPSTGAAGTFAAGGSGGMAAATGAAGIAGSDGTHPIDLPPPPPIPFCVGKELRFLPYPIAADFTSRFVLRPESFSEVPSPDCDEAVVPAPDAGVADAGSTFAAPTICEAFRYDPDLCVAQSMAGGFDPGASCWAGVIFTPEMGGFGAPGICISQGAIAVHFLARASRDGARVKFGSIREGLNSTEFFLELTTSWSSYTISIPAGEDYDAASPQAPGGVWNAFSIIVEPQDHAGGTTIFVSDVIWDRK